MMEINRAELRGKPLDLDCKKAHTTRHEYGQQDERVFCLGLCDKKTDDIIKKCLNCKAWVKNAEPLETKKDDKTCYNCTNRYLCPNFAKFGACLGWCDKEAFIGLIKLNFGFLLPEQFIDDRFKQIQQIQDERWE